MAIAPSQNVTSEKVVSEIVDFLVESPSTEAIAAFKFSPELDQRLHTLLERNSSASGLMSDEREELDALMRYTHLLTMLKVKARRMLANSVSRAFTAANNSNSTPPLTDAMLPQCISVFIMTTASVFQAQ